MKARSVVVAMGLFATTGCWAQAGYGPGRGAHNDLESTVTAANVADLEVDWTGDVGSRASEATLQQGKAFVRTDGAVTALDGSSGDEIWRRNSSGANGLPLQGTGVPAIADGLLITPYSHKPCALQQLHPTSGAFVVEHWYGLAGFPGYIPPIEDTTWTCAGTDVLVVGEKVVVTWSQTLSVATPPSHPSCQIERRSYLATSGVEVRDVDDTSMPDWSLALVKMIGCGSGPVPPIGPPPQVSMNGDKVVVAHGTQVSAYPLAPCGAMACAPEWTVDVGGAIVGPPLSHVGSDVAVALADGRIAVVDGTSHAIEWTATVGTGIDQPLAATGDTIFATTTDGSVVALAAGGCGSTDCPAAWTAALSSPASARPSIGGDVLYVGTAGGTLIALPAAGCGAATCAPLWSASMGSAVSGAPAISAGQIVVGSADGTVTAFALP